MPIHLYNKILQVTIDKPGEVYCSSRFDWTGQISQVVLNNRHTFCTTEIADGSQLTTKGIGLCNEFGISTPVGFNDCKIGHQFPKIGVGLLTKENDEPYNFFKSYKVTPASFETLQYSDSKATINSGIHACNGYSFYMEKTFEIVNNQLVVSYSLTNNGTKTIETEEYCHNFVAIDAMPVDSSYCLKLQSKIEPTGFTKFVNPDNCIAVENNCIKWNKMPESDFFITDLNQSNNKLNSWQIENSSSMTAMSEKCNFTSSMFNLWGKGHTISPEIFIHLTLLPSETKIWERKFEFFELKK